LVCVMKNGGKLAIWGKKSSRRNIDLVHRTGVPCVIDCDYRAPNKIHE
jgi:hypothetical protein